ncbi:MAG: FmdB family zinc ribbon protein [Terriglobia bacterium]
MPIYEYVCAKCGRQFEIIQKFSDSPLKTCSECKGKLSKLISQSSFQLKGGGWYVTDYAGKSTPSKKEESKSGTDSSAKTEKPPKKEVASN